jgi:hypothetical protein
LLFQVERITRPIPCSSPGSSCSTFSTPFHQLGQRSACKIASQTSSIGASICQIVSKGSSFSLGHRDSKVAERHRGLKAFRHGGDASKASRAGAGGLHSGLDCGVGGVREGRGNAVFVPADTFVFDCFFEAVFVVIETSGTGFHFDENDFLDALFVQTFEDEEVDWRADDPTNHRCPKTPNGKGWSAGAFESRVLNLTPG